MRNPLGGFGSLCRRGISSFGAAAARVSVAGLFVCGILSPVPVHAAAGAPILWHAHAPGATRATACTAALAQPSPRGPVYVVTAAHCAPEAGEEVEVVFDARARLEQGRTIIEGSRRVGLSGDSIAISPRFDLLWVPLEGRATEGEGRALFSHALPAPGAALHVAGFPGGAGPAEATCTLVGPVLRADRELDGFRVDQEMACPRRDTWRGMSGAPVTDAAGQVVGFVLAAAMSGTVLYFQPVLAANIQASGIPIRPGEGTGTRRFDNIRLGAGARGYRLEARYAVGLLDGPATLFGPDGTPHARLTFRMADLRGPMTLFGPDGGVMLDADVAADRLTVKSFDPPTSLGEAAGSTRAPPASGDATDLAIARLIEWALMGRSGE